MRDSASWFECLFLRPGEPGKALNYKAEMPILSKPAEVLRRGSQRTAETAAFPEKSVGFPHPPLDDANPAPTVIIDFLQPTIGADMAAVDRVMHKALDSEVVLIRRSPNTLSPAAASGCALPCCC
jgi:hypothetical protein